MSALRVIPGDPRSSVIVHVPHSSRFIPTHVRNGILLDSSALKRELDALTDSFTDLIAEWAASHAGVRPWLCVNSLSRLVVDPERFPDEREELNSVGMGVVYERTSDGSALRSLTVDEISGLVDRYFTPYANAFADLVDERLAAVGEVTIIDQHSYPREPLPYELHADGPTARGVHRHRPVPHSADTGRHSGCLLLTAHADRRRRLRLSVRRLLRAAAALRHRCERVGSDDRAAPRPLPGRAVLHDCSGNEGFWQGPRRPHRPDRARPMSVPIWFLDIDGVVNALARPAPIGYQITTANTMGRGWRIAYSREVIDFINRVNREGLAEVRWLTTWQQDAHRELAPVVGLDAFPAYDDPEDVESPMSWWKGQIVTDELLDNGRPFVWTDDDIEDDDVEIFGEESVPSLLIAPTPSTGLVAGNLTSIERFLSRLAGEQDHG